MELVILKDKSLDKNDSYLRVSTDIKILKNASIMEIGLKFMKTVLNWHHTSSCYKCLRQSKIREVLSFIIDNNNKGGGKYHNFMR